MWAPHELTEDEKARVITEVTSIVGYTPSIPNKLGVWHLVEGGERTLDDLTMRITGGSQHMLRTYADDLTGVSLTVLVLFGPAEPVLPHTPEVCYPSSGYALDRRAFGLDRKFARATMPRAADLRAARFRSAVYPKIGGRAMHAGRRSTTRSGSTGDGRPTSAAGRKFPRRNPGIFKVQVQRQVAEGRACGQDDPMEQFLSPCWPSWSGRSKRPGQGGRRQVGRPGPRSGFNGRCGSVRRSSRERGAGLVAARPGPPGGASPVARRAGP